MGPIHVKNVPPAFMEPFVKTWALGGRVAYSRNQTTLCGHPSEPSCAKAAGTERSAHLPAHPPALGNHCISVVCIVCQIVAFFYGRMLLHNSTPQTATNNYYYYDSCVCFLLLLVSVLLLLALLFLLSLLVWYANKTSQYIGQGLKLLIGSN